MQRVRMLKDVAIVIGIGVGIAVVLCVVLGVFENMCWLQIWFDDLWAGRVAGWSGGVR